MLVLCPSACLMLPHHPHFGEMKTPESFRWKPLSQSKHTKEVKSQELLQARGRAILCPRSSVSRRQKSREEAPVTYKVVGTEATHFSRFKAKEVILKGAPGKA